MNVESTRLVDHRSLPNTRPARWNQTTSKMRAAAPDAKKIAPIENSTGMPSMTWSRCRIGRVVEKERTLSHRGAREIEPSWCEVARQLFRRALRLGAVQGMSGAIVSRGGSRLPAPRPAWHVTCDYGNRLLNRIRRKRPLVLVRREPEFKRSQKLLKHVMRFFGMV